MGLGPLFTFNRPWNIIFGIPFAVVGGIMLRASFRRTKKPLYEIEIFDGPNVNHLTDPLEEKYTAFAFDIRIGRVERTVTVRTWDPIERARNGDYLIYGTVFSEVDRFPVTMYDNVRIRYNPTLQTGTMAHATR